MKRYQKRAQFFLLAAVIISVVVISLGLIVNKAISSPEPDGFQNLGDEIKRESNAVINFEMRTFVVADEILDDFVIQLADETRDRNPDANFIFVFGNNEKLTLLNYGAFDVEVVGESCEEGEPCVIPGASFPITSKACINSNQCTTINSVYKDRDGETYNEELRVWQKVWTPFSNSGKGSLELDVRGNVFNFSIGDIKEVTFIIQKDVGNESFVSVK